MTGIYKLNRFKLYVQLMDKIRVRDSFKEAVISEMIRLADEQKQKE